jgi:hypothetical protein
MCQKVPGAALVTDNLQKQTTVKQQENTSPEAKI